MDKLLDQKMKGYLDSVYIMSHSYSTIASYRLSIVNQNKTGFRDYLQQTYNIDELEFVEQTKQEKFDVYATLRDHVVFLDKSNYKPKSITTRLAAIKGYLRFLGLKIYTEDCKHIIKIPKNIREPEVALTKELILRVLRNVPQRVQTVVLVLASSEMRIGELVQLRLSDVDFTTTPTTIRLPGKITKTKQARETFITAEATKALKDYLIRSLKWDEKQNNSYLDDVTIFGKDHLNDRRIKETQIQPAHLVAESSLMKQLKYYIEKIPDLNKINPNGIRVIHFHALRKFFRTTVGNISGRDFAEALIGHQFYMNTYYQLSDEKKREMYLEVEPHLTISDFKQVEKDLKTVYEKYSKLENKFDELLTYFEENNIGIPEYIQQHWGFGLQKRKINYIDLFAGAGGMSEGFDQEGFENIFAIDCDKDSCDTYKNNFPSHIVLEKNIEQLSEKEILNLTKEKEIDVIIGGTPCQGFSIAGKIGRNFIDDPRNHLFKEFARVVSILNPKFFIIENVARVHNHNKGKTREEIFALFEKLGYKVNCELLNSVDYGVPQKRNRIFIIGNRLEFENKFPNKMEDNHKTVEEEIGDLPHISSGETSEIPNHVAMNHSEQMLYKMSFVSNGGSRAQIPKNIRPKSGDVRKYIKHDKDKPSVCVTGDMRKIFHYSQNRALTVRELARLQSFSDDFVFLGSNISQQQQVGNAVPPLLAQSIAKTIKQQLVIKNEN